MKPILKLWTKWKVIAPWIMLGSIIPYLLGLTALLTPGINFVWGFVVMVACATVIWDTEDAAKQSGYDRGYKDGYDDGRRNEYESDEVDG